MSAAFLVRGWIRRQEPQVPAPSKPSVRTWPPPPKSASRSRRPSARKRSLLASRPSLPRLELEPHHVDIIGLGADRRRDLPGRRRLSALGGRRAREAAPSARCASCSARSATPSRRRSSSAGRWSWRASSARRAGRCAPGCSCLTAALTLALAAGTLGLGPGAAHGRAASGARARSSPAAGSSARPSCGSLASALDRRRRHPRRVPVHRRADPGHRRDARRRRARHGRRVAGTGGAARSTEELDRRSAAARRPRPPRRPAAAAAKRRRRPSPRRVCRPSPTPPSWSSAPPHVEAPPIADELRRKPGHRAECRPDALEEDEDARRGRARARRRQCRPGGPHPAGPLPRRRSPTTPTSSGACPAPRFLTRSTGEAAKPDTAGQEQVARTLVETLGHFGIEAKVIGRVTGPHITRYELRLAPGHQGRQGRPAQGRPRLCAGRHRHPHPGADPRQAGGRRRGAERAPADRPPRRRLPGAAAGLVAADRLARQGHRRPGDRRRPGQDAPPARRRHDRRRQVGVRQRDALLDPAARHAARGPARARRPQAGRAQPLRVDPAPAHAR